MAELSTSDILGELTRLSAKSKKLDSVIEDIDLGIDLLNKRASEHRLRAIGSYDRDYWTGRADALNYAIGVLKSIKAEVER